MTPSLRRAEEAVIEWAGKLCKAYERPPENQHEAIARAQAHENLSMWVYRLAALRASQAGEPDCDNCRHLGTDGCLYCSAPTPPAEEAKPHKWDRWTCVNCGLGVNEAGPICAPSTEKGGERK